jgi:hypothetical protein
MADRDADIQSIPGKAPHDPSTEEPRAAEHHNRGHGMPPLPGWPARPAEEMSRLDQYLMSLKRALRKRDVPRSVQDFLSNG